MSAAADSILLTRLKEKFHSQNELDPIEGRQLHLDFEKAANTGQGCVCSHGKCIKRIFDITQRSSNRGLSVGGHSSSCRCQSCNVPNATSDREREKVQVCWSSEQQQYDDMSHMGSFTTMVNDIRQTTEHLRDSKKSPMNETTIAEAKKSGTTFLMQYFSDRRSNLGATNQRNAYTYSLLHVQLGKVEVCKSTWMAIYGFGNDKLDYAFAELKKGKIISLSQYPSLIILILYPY